MGSEKRIEFNIGDDDETDNDEEFVHHDNEEHPQQQQLEGQELNVKSKERRKKNKSRFINFYCLYL